MRNPAPENASLPRPVQAAPPGDDVTSFTFPDVSKIDPRLAYLGAGVLAGLVIASPGLELSEVLGIALGVIGSQYLYYSVAPRPPGFLIPIPEPVNDALLSANPRSTAATTAATFPRTRSGRCTPPVSPGTTKSSGRAPCPRGAGVGARASRHADWRLQLLPLPPPSGRGAAACRGVPRRNAAPGRVAARLASLRPEDAPFGSLEPAPRAVLFALVACGYVLARLTREQESRAFLGKVAELDPGDVLGARRLLAVLYRGGQDGRFKEWVPRASRPLAGPGQSPGLPYLAMWPRFQPV